MTRRMRRRSAGSTTDELTVHAGGPGPTPAQLLRQIVDVCLTVPLFAVTPLLRPWHRRWGATDAEVAAAVPGDEIVRGCQYVVTRAISIAAPPTTIWPWLAQTGFGKAGFYSHDLLDNFGHPSAGRIVSGLQDLRVGDWVPMFTKVNDTTAFKVAKDRAVLKSSLGETGQHLVLGAHAGGRRHTPRHPHPHPVSVAPAG